jgi:hypothetical protein
MSAWPPPRLPYGTGSSARRRGGRGPSPSLSSWPGAHRDPGAPARRRRRRRSRAVGSCASFSLLHGRGKRFSSIYTYTWSLMTALPLVSHMTVKPKRHGHGHGHGTRRQSTTRSSRCLFLFLPSSLVMWVQQDLPTVPDSCRPVVALFGAASVLCGQKTGTEQSPARPDEHTGPLLKD